MDMPYLTVSVRFRRLALVLDESIKMLREAQQGGNWSALRFISKDAFRFLCGGKVTSDSPTEFSLVRQIILARRDFAAFLDKTFRPEAAELAIAKHFFEFHKREEYMADGNDSDSETLPGITDFIDNSTHKHKPFETIWTLTRISLFLHILRNRLRPGKGISQKTHLESLTPNVLLSPIPHKYMSLAGFANNTEPISFLILGIIARRTYRTILFKEQYPIDTLIDSAKSTWKRHWDKTAPLEERCSDNEEEWEDLDLETPSNASPKTQSSINAAV